MTRSLKALGLVLVAALALSAVVASAASAEPAKFTAGVKAGGKVTVTGGQVGTDKFVFGLGPEYTCATATVTGEGVTKGPESTEATLTPTYATCHGVITILGAKVTRTATVTMNGCDYVFNATKNTASTPFSADLTINCPAGKSIEIHVYTTAAEPHNNTTLCTYVIHHQTILNAFQLTNIAGPPMHVHAHVNASFAVTNILPGGTCTTSTTLQYIGTETLKAFDETGRQVDLTVS